MTHEAITPRAWLELQNNEEAILPQALEAPRSQDLPARAARADVPVGPVDHGAMRRAS
ncbi:hypothetical protein ACMHYB_19880 [Sorangium sp. So ce1128]